MLPRPTSHSKALGPGVAGPELAVATSAILDRPPQPSPQNPLCGADSFMVDPHSINDPARQHTQYPYVTGTSVLGIKYRDGVLVACDTLGAYGSTKRYKSVERIKKVNDRCIIAASGELSDFQYLMKLLDELTTEDFRAGGYTTTTAAADVPGTDTIIPYIRDNGQFKCTQMPICWLRPYLSSARCCPSNGRRGQYSIVTSSEAVASPASAP